MSVNTPTARRPLRSGRAPLTTPATYPKYLPPDTFPANARHGGRIGRSRSAKSVLYAAEFNRVNTPVKRGRVLMQPAPRAKFVSNIANKPWVHPVSRIAPRTEKPLSRAFAKFIRGRLALTLGAKVGARLVPGLGLALTAWDVYNFISSVNNDGPASGEPAAWAGGGAERLPGDNGWKITGYYRTVDYASDGWQYPPKPTYTFVQKLTPNPSFDLLDSSPDRHWLHNPTTIFSGDFYNWPANGSYLTASEDWPFGQTEVVEVKVAPSLGPTARPNGRPAYNQVFAETPPPRAPRPSGDFVMDISTGKTRVGFVSPGSAGRSPGERKAARSTGYYAVARLLAHASEVNDFLEILYENFEVPEGSTEYEAFLWIVDHWHVVDWQQFLIDLALNEVEDQIVGRFFFGAIDKQYRKLSGGRRLPFGAFLATL